MGLITYFRQRLKNRERRTFIKQVVEVYEADGGMATVNGRLVHAKDIRSLNDEDLKRIVFHNAKLRVSVR